MSNVPRNKKMPSIFGDSAIETLANLWAYSTCSVVSDSLGRHYRLATVVGAVETHNTCYCIVAYHALRM